MPVIYRKRKRKGASNTIKMQWENKDLNKSCPQLATETEPDVSLNAAICVSWFIGISLCCSICFVSNLGLSRNSQKVSSAFLSTSSALLFPSLPPHPPQPMSNAHCSSQKPFCFFVYLFVFCSQKHLRAMVNEPLSNTNETVGPLIISRLPSLYNYF